MALSGTMTVWIHRKAEGTVSSFDARFYTNHATLMRAMRECEGMATLQSLLHGKASVGVRPTCGTFFIDGKKAYSVMEG